MRTSFSILYERFLDVLYPPTCLVCEVDNTLLCNACLERILFEEPTTDQIVSIGAYANPVLRSLLTSLKYRSAACLKVPLQNLLRRFRSGTSEPFPWVNEPTLSICSIPSDARRVRERGVDHIQVLLDLVHQELVPWATRAELLERTRHVTQNAALPANELRQLNVQGAFQAAATIQGAVLLMDDVYTTGATWHEAARILTEAGASKVYGFVFARKHKKV